MQWRVENPAQLQPRRRPRQSPGGPVALPHDVQDDVFECGIAIMTVCPPAAGPDVHFHVAAEGRAIAKLKHRAAKIRPAFTTEETRMKNAQPHAVTTTSAPAEPTLTSPADLASCNELETNIRFVS